MAKRKRLTLDQKQIVVSDYKTGEYSFKTLAEKYGVSDSTIGNIVNKALSKEEINKIKLGNMRVAQEKRSDKYQEEHEEVETIKVVKSYTPKTFAPEKSSSNNTLFFPDTMSKELTEVNFKPTYKTVGLINKRHYLGVDKYFYQYISDRKIFDFEWLEKEAIKFIFENIEFDKDGLACQGLIVRVTGLQTALVAVINACYKLKVNLITEHHQLNKEHMKDMPEYMRQVVFDDFPISKSNIPAIVEHIGNSSSKLYCFRSDINDYNGIDSFYQLYVSNYKNKYKNILKGRNNVFPLATYSILSTSIEEALIFNAIMTKAFNNDRSLHRKIVLNEYVVDQYNKNGYSAELVQHSYI